MRRSIFLIPAVLMLALVMLTAAWADEPGIVTTLDENGNPITEIVDENGNKMTIGVVDDGLQEELDIDWIEEGGQPADDPGDPGDAEENVPDGGAGYGPGDDAPADADPQAGTGNAGNGGLRTGNNAMGDTNADGQPKDAAPTAPAAEVKDKEAEPAPLVEQIKEILPESVQELVTPDETGQTAISDTTLILILVILLVLLLVIVAGIVLVIVLIVTKNKKQDAKSTAEKEEKAPAASADEQ